MLGLNRVTCAVCATLLYASYAMPGCAPSVDYARAVDVHNVFRRVIVDVDQAYSPMLIEADRIATEMHANDAEAYALQMKPWVNGVGALRLAKEIEQRMRRILQDRSGSAASMLMNVSACAADAVERLALSLSQTPAGDRLWSTVWVTSTPLRQIAQGAECDEAASR